jgi:(1->4)-alpha-D-glucan 1-alpha-D-glucosylmutase
MLRLGRGSPHAAAFDVDWEAGGGKVLLPVLGDAPDELERLELGQDEQGEAVLRYYDNAFPVAPGTLGGTAQEVHARQHYELASWRRADAELNYRRFFAVTTLAGIRVELPEVFDASHAEVRRWVDRGWVDGLRIDHPDGLRDPEGYLDRLAELTGGRYVLVEKILEGDEQLPPAWKTAGTTGYDALGILDRLFVDPAGQEDLDRLDTDLRGGLRVDWPRMLRSTKRAVADGILRAEVLRLARLVPDVTEAVRGEGGDPGDVPDAIAELLSSFEVYRTYLPQGRQHLDDAVAVATTSRPELAELLAVLADRLTRIDTEFALRFQQTSGMVMAKGVEDCAFYRWTRLTSLTEVGAEPSRWSIPPAEFHELQAARAARTPASMTTLSTHDTKRAEDTRARISVLSELAPEWSAAVRRWLKLAPLDDGPLADMLLQAAVGAWPIERDRMHAYAEKAAREAGNSTGWIDSDEQFEQRMHAFVDAFYDDQVLAGELSAFAERIAGFGWSNSLSAKLLQLTGTGVPDVYQGTELWDTSLVDPDNRRPVDFAERRAVLARLDGGWVPPVDAGGAAKLLVTMRALRLRRDRPEAFTGYSALPAVGPAAEHLVAVDRGGAVALATRLPVGLERSGGWRDTQVPLPEGRWRDLLSGRTVEGGLRPVAELLGTYPVALLVPA